MDDREQSRRQLLLGAAGTGTVTIATLAGCLGDDEGGANGDETNDDDADDVLEIETREGEDDEPAFVFDPAIAELEPGTTVRWVNTDGVFHTVTATDSLENRTASEEFNEEIRAEGDTFEWTPEEEGIQHYYCEPHAGFMIGTLAVGDVDDEELEAAEDVHDDPEGADDADDESVDDEDADDDPVDDEDEIDEDEIDEDEIDEEFVDMTGEDAVEIETRRGEDDEPDFVFDPAFVRVDAGTAIEWVNTDGVFHTVTSTDSIDSRQSGGDEFDATISSEDDTFEWDAEEAGTQPYYCSPHAGFMYGALEIE
ncbi:halocyanin [Natronococcus pandeyae]|uniref:Halocyanin n=1 Tax=Natronococcus pandeyae TaxID=2055836 RepID=A0A8J8TQ68_9EURY|nr:plastocyanin/azurin family copper-binding protein [Natronococcus pandeyae]TYL38541.1 halocyanin [Natronococcus pandeyae]